MDGNPDGSPRRTRHRSRLTAQDFWNAAFRGFAPGGWNSVPPEATDMGDVPPFSEDVESFVKPDNYVKLEQTIAPVPVVIHEDLSHTTKRVERFLITNTQSLSNVTSTLIVPRNPFRHQSIITNLGSGIIYLGHNESVGTSGFSMAVNTILVLGTTREVWALAATNGAQISLVMEYDKDTMEN